MSALVRRIAAGMGANAMGQAISIGTQLAALPIFLSHWSAAQYGVWLMLSAVPSYFSMADAGMVTAAGNKMTMAMGRGDSAAANRIFQSALVFVLAVCVMILTPTMALLAWVPLPGLGSAELRMALGALVLVVLLSFFNGLAEAIFRATGRYGLGTMFGHLIRLAEWCGGMIGLWLDGGYLGVASGMLAARATGVLIVTTVAGLTTRGIVWGVAQARFAEVREMVKPAVYFLVFPLANALSLQGFTLLIGAMFGAASVAIFNTYRTLARVTVQATSVLSHAVGPEMSRLYGSDRIDALARLFRRSHGLSMALVLLLGLLVGLVAPMLLEWWTHGRIPYDRGLLWAMLAYAAISGVAHVPRILLMSINRHGTLALTSLLVAGLALPAAWLVGQSFSLTMTAWSLAGSELLLAMITFQLSRNAMHHVHLRTPANLQTRLP